MSITETMAPGRLAAFDQAVAAYRDACIAFAHMTGTGEDLRAAEAALRKAGTDPATGLITLPVAAVRFTDVRADGARLRAVNGRTTGGEVSMLWGGLPRPQLIDDRTYDAYDLIQVRA